MLFTCTRIAEDSMPNIFHVLWFKHLYKANFLTLFYIRGEQIHPRLIKLCAVSRFDVQTTSNLLTAKTNMSFICVSNFRSLN